MLSLIRVSNYAVVDEVEVEFQAGLSVLTGETGAGKSILVDALGLALGDRADAGAVRHGTRKAEISVIFDCPPGHAALDWLAEHGLEDGESCSLRRVVSAEGRSRAFVNNQPVTLPDLRTLGSLLIDIHGQHAHQSLVQPAEQRRLLDGFGGHVSLAKDVTLAFARWEALGRELDARLASTADREARIELLKFQIGELEAMALEDGEFERLETEHGRLANVEQIAHAVQSALEALYESESASAHSLIAGACRDLARVSEHDPDVRQLAVRLDSAEIELRDLASLLAGYRDRLDPDPARLEYVESRLARVGSLARRHRVDAQDLHAVLANLTSTLDELTGDEASLESLQTQLADAWSTYLELATTLSTARASTAEELSREVSAQFDQLGLADGEFLVVVTQRAEARADASGLDAVEYRVRLNPGQPFGPLSRVASGGELSRISLAIEVVAVRDSTIPTLVFDEVDAGIGGRVAEMVGIRLADIARSRQVLCVTHLPQVASQGDHHYRVLKLSDGKTSRTNVRRLQAEERVEELSRMLGGVEITDATRAHAEDMISRAAR
jgi:DNA repair protein RecN (Recombination protein N)